MTEHDPVGTPEAVATAPLERDEIRRVLEDELSIDMPQEVWDEMSDGDILLFLGHLSGCINIGLEDLLEAVGVKVNAEEGDTYEV